ncbi:MAG: hypothetical protein MK179_07840, partial [Pirellulaceae bacterium]|nr:hypothetical protein [Pirellulaceae bacterium]
HNLEHTRSQLWKGLSAQLIQGRKFFGTPQRNGVGRHWYPIGPPDTHFAFVPENTYTQRYDPDAWCRRRELFSQRIGNVTDGVICGLGQAGVLLQQGHEYQARVALYSDAELDAEVRVGEPKTDGWPVSAHFHMLANEWQEFEFKFVWDAITGPVDFNILFTADANLYIGAVSLLPTDSFHGMRRDVVALLKQIGCRLLRWPGGNFAGDYRWQDGLLPVDRRAPLASVLPMETLAHTDGYDCHEIGTDEFLALCEEIGAEPTLTINPACEGPELAAAWVEYCNGDTTTRWGRVRAERGRVEPYHVRYWSLGNEFGQGHMEGPNTPAGYARHIRPYALAMRELDPSILLVCSGDYSRNEWFTDGLRQLDDVVDFVAHHHYTAMMRPTHMRNYSGPVGDEDFQFIATNPTAAIAQELEELRNRIDIHAREGCRPTISLDEWNVWHAWHRIPGVVEGIHNASMLNFLCNEADTVAVSLGCFFAPVNEGAIVVEPERAWLPPGGIVFPLFVDHQENTRIDLGAQDGLADVYAAASLDEERQTVVLTIVNRHPQEEREVSIALCGSKYQNVTTVLLSAPDYRPATTFCEGTLECTTNELGWQLVLPKHSVVKIAADVCG